VSTVEEDTPPPRDTFRRYVWDTLRGLSYWRAYWARRLSGAALGLIVDSLAEGATQAFYARLPGHPQQAPDSLARVGLDRQLVRFRGETAANWVARVVDAWDDYPQGGTPQQMLRVVNQWGNAGWPTTWDDLQVTLTEDPDPAVFEFEIEIPFGLIDPPIPAVYYGTGASYGDLGLFYGISDTDIPMLLYLVRKWKPSRSRAFVKVFTSISNSVTFIV
jgi:hypothetical protein